MGSVRRKHRNKEKIAERPFTANPGDEGDRKRDCSAGRQVGSTVPCPIILSAVMLGMKK